MFAKFLIVQGLELLSKILLQNQRVADWLFDDKTRNTIRDVSKAYEAAYFERTGNFPW
ncbi:hypothetical protein [Rhodoflexus caldus]|uniref:hypothetical protein n=1 Tax=Rhodoflexus caldus TaxID=2891236 RepID=UPI002029DE28|nr:hypothetical protein [Rhodoflexus caldus]